MSRFAMNPWLVARAGMAAHRAAYAVFLMLIAIAVAAGTSCRCQIAAGAGRNALHPAQILDRASDITAQS